mgnify:CR=1 FL=1
MNTFLKLKYIAVCLLVAVLGGCTASSEHPDLTDYIAETKRRPKGQIEPLPTFSPYRAFIYGAMTSRSPFDPPVEEKRRLVAAADSNVKPDLSREKEYLEGFSLSALKMVGTLTKDGIQWALINDADGGVHRVTEGNFLGKNHGKIVAANSTQLEILEIVSDGLKGWLERPRSLKLEEKE